MASIISSPPPSPRDGLLRWVILKPVKEKIWRSGHTENILSFDLQQVFILDAIFRGVANQLVFVVGSIEGVAVASSSGGIERVSIALIRVRLPAIDGQGVVKTPSGVVVPFATEGEGQRWDYRARVGQAIIDGAVWPAGAGDVVVLSSFGAILGFGVVVIVGGGSGEDDSGCEEQGKTNCYLSLVVRRSKRCAELKMVKFVRNIYPNTREVIVEP